MWTKFGTCLVDYFTVSLHNPNNRHLPALWSYKGLSVAFVKRRRFPPVTRAHNASYVRNFWVNTLRPRPNGRRFADDTFKRIFLNENVRISIKVSLNFVPKGTINNNPTLVQIMAWRRLGDKPLSEPMVVSLLSHICVARHQWVNTSRPSGVYASINLSSLVQIMACRLVSAYLNQWWDIVNVTRRNKIHWNINRTSYIFIQENLFEYIVCEMSDILSRPQCVNSWISKSHNRQHQPTGIPFTNNVQL